MTRPTKASAQTPESGTAPEHGAATSDSPPLRVGIDIRRLGDFGVGTYIQNLVAALARLGDHGTYVLVGHTNDQFERLGRLPPNFSFEPYRLAFNSRRSHLHFPILVRRLNLDLFHMPHRWVPYFMPGTYVATLHDINNILYPQEEASVLGERVRRHLLRHGLGRSACVIAVSAATKRDAIEHLGLPAEQIQVVPNAIDQRVAQPVRQHERLHTLQRYQIHDPFVLYAGRIQPHKNIPRLIEAFAVVRAELENHPQYANLRLIVIGDELNAYPAVRHAVIKSRVQESVRFLGFVPVETLRCFYDAAVAFAFPSLYEGFGLPPLEAMVHGTPVVTSSASSLPEAVGDAAVLVNPENVFDIARGLRQVLLDDSLRERLRKLGFLQVRRFSWDSSVKRVLEIYRDVTSQP